MNAKLTIKIIVCRWLETWAELSRTLSEKVEYTLILTGGD